MRARIASTLVFLPALLLAPSPPAGALEKCVSPAGKVSYVEGACPAGSKSSTVRGTEKPAPPPSASPAAPAKGTSAAARGRAAPAPSPQRTIVANTARGSAAAPRQPVAGMTGAREGVTEIDVRYFDVRGSDPDALVAALKAAPGGLHGQAEWALSYKYNPRRAGRACTVAELNTTLKQTMNLPRWTPPPGTPASVTASWFRYVNARRKHSEGHLAHGRAALEEFRASLAMTNVRCDKLEARVKELYRKVLDEQRRQEKSYDFETASGRTEGMEFGGAFVGSR